MTMPISAADIELRTTLAAQHAAIAARIDALTAAKDSIREQLIDLGPGDAGPLRVQITDNRRLNQKRFEEAYPIEDRPDLYSSKPDPRLIRAKLGEDAAGAMYDVVGAVVKVVTAE